MVGTDRINDAIARLLPLELFEPREKPLSIDWQKANVYLPTGPNGRGGRAFDVDAYPHIAAPGGPADAFDDPRVRSIWLQWASRLGKTAWAQACLLYQAACDPCPILFGTSTESLAVRSVSTKLYSMIGQCPELRDQLRPVNRRQQTRIDLRDCRIYVAWSGSTTTLADLAARLLHANEIDKWDQSASDEGDSLKLFLERAKDIPNRKVICESTPSIKGRSRVERGLLASTNCRYWVPCPHCQGYQVLRLDQIKWDHLDNGKSDPALAAKTARYECAHCGQVIRDEHRTKMMRRGVWAPEGCGVDSAKAAAAVEHWSGARGGDGACLMKGGWGKADWITGQPLRDGTEAGYQLSSLYALTLSWGDIAKEFVDSKGNPRTLQNFFNSWLGETWEIIRQQQTWEQLGQRLAAGYPIGRVPAEAVFCTVGVDKQVDHYVYVCTAWGQEQRGYVIDYGTAPGLDAVWEAAIGRVFPYVDHGELRPVLALIDSGYDPEEIYRFCLERRVPGLLMLPCKGGLQGDAAYELRQPGKGALAKDPILHVNDAYYQPILQRAFNALRPGDAGSISVPADSASDEDLLTQFLNEAPVSRIDARKQDQLQWQRVHEHIPNDFRDGLKYSAAAADLYVRRQWGRVQPRATMAAIAAKQARQQPQRSTFTTPDGRPFLVTER